MSDMASILGTGVIALKQLLVCHHTLASRHSLWNGILQLMLTEGLPRTKLMLCTLLA